MVTNGGAVFVCLLVPTLAVLVQGSMTCQSLRAEVEATKTRGLSYFNDSIHVPANAQIRCKKFGASLSQFDAEQ